MVEVKSEDRERWPSRIGFYFAAIGAAVGFGNVWRFPSLVFEYGGVAFFVPYILALIFIGLPILILEISLGQYYETGDVHVFGSINRRLSGVGVSSIACGYMLVTYYSMLLAWVFNAFFDSFSNNFWAQDQVTGEEAVAYFFDSIIGQSTLGDDKRPTRIVWENVGYSLLTWFFVYLCVAFGIKATGRITYVTMGLPIVMLFVFLGRAVSLEGSENGIDQYIRQPDWSVLSNKPEIWSTAVSQIFFSLGVTFGIMTAYGSHCKRDEPAFVNSCVIAFSNSMFSFVSGFAVFASLGHLAYLEGEEDISNLQYSGFGLVFGSWPVVLGTLPGGEHWIRLLFIMLLLLGIDSAFSFMEGILAVLGDTVTFRNTAKWKLSLGLTFCAFLCSLLYATDAGLVFLDVVDYYINFVMLLVGGFECFTAGWTYTIDDQIKNLGKPVVFAYMMTTYGSVILASALWFSITNGTAIWAGFVALILSYSLGMVCVVHLMKKRMNENPGERNMKSMFYELMLSDVVSLRNDLAAVVGRLPLFWAVIIKHFIPQIILVLFANLCAAENASGDKTFGHYGEYVFWPYQLLGILIVVFVGFLFFSSIFRPELYGSLQRPDEEKETIHPDEGGMPASVASEESVGIEDGAVEENTFEMEQSPIVEVQSEKA